MKLQKEFDHTFFHLDDLPDDLYSHKDLVKIANSIHKLRFGTPLGSLKIIDARLAQLFTDPDVDRYTIPFAIDHYLLAHSTKPYALTLFSDKWFTNTLHLADKELYGRIYFSEYNFAKYYYYYFVVYKHNKVLAEKYDLALTRYEDCFNGDLYKDMGKYRSIMEKIVGRYR